MRWTLVVSGLVACTGAPTEEPAPPDLVAEQLRDQAYALVEEGRLQEARPLLERAVEVDPDHAWPHYELGVIDFADGRYEDAVATLSRAIERAGVPLLIKALEFRGQSLAALDEHQRAVEDFSRALELAEETSEDLLQAELGYSKERVLGDLHNARTDSLDYLAR